ncbi:MAG: molybdopterin molybdotransferase MoeA [Calditrichia bacterium]
MITVDEAIRQIQQHLPALSFEYVDLDKSLNRVLYENLAAVEPSPSYTNSAMDGFAVRWTDVQSVSPENPVILQIVGESQAGIPFQGRVKTGEAVHISTGAMLPEGADTVVPVEECHVKDSLITVVKIKSQGNHVRYKGEEFKPGEVLMEKGTILGPEQLALLASQGISKIKVFRQPRIVLFTTGTELKHFAEDNIESFQIRDSNSIMIQTLIAKAGGRFVGHHHISDNLNETIETVRNLEEQADILIFTGGVSVGPHDHVRDAAESLGYRQIFWKIKQKPGKPFFLAAKENKLWFGLPGNPVSAFMGFVHYIFPSIRSMTGEMFHWPSVNATMLNSTSIKGDRIQFRRVKLRREGQKLMAEVLKKQGSHMLTSISDAHGYIMMQPGHALEKGQQIQVYLFPWRLYEWNY